MKKFYLLFILLSVLTFSQNFLDNDQNLLGDWNHKSSDAGLWLISNINQNIPDPNQTQGLGPSNGSITIDGISDVELSYMYYLSPGFYYDEDAFQLFLGNNPLIDLEGYDYFQGDSLSGNVNLPYCRLEYFSFPSYNYQEANMVIIDTLGGELIEKWYMNDNSSGYISVDSNLSVEVNNLILASEENNSLSYSLLGMLTQNIISIDAGEEFEVFSPIFTEDFGFADEDDFLQWKLYSDGTGHEIYAEVDNYYSSLNDTSEIQWYNNNDSLYIVIYLEEEGVSDTMGFAYSLTNDTLNINATINFCDEMMDEYYPDYCYEMMENMLGVGDIEEVNMKVDVVMIFQDPTFVGTDSNFDLLGIPKSFAIHQNYPNPFNPVTNLSYDLPKDSFVNITIYDMLGNAVNNLVNTDQSSGYKSVQWNATNNQGQHVSAGVYLYSIETKGFRQTKKMILLK